MHKRKTTAKGTPKTPSPEAKLAILCTSTSQTSFHWSVFQFANTNNQVSRAPCPSWPSSGFFQTIVLQQTIYFDIYFQKIGTSRKFMILWRCSCCFQSYKVLNFKEMGSKKRSRIVGSFAPSIIEKKTLYF